MSVDPAPHLIVPFAQSSADGWLQATSALALKNLGPLLRGMKLIDTDNGPADSLSPPHERALAKALGLIASDDGLIPWAAHDAYEAKVAHGSPGGSPGQAWAYITPCHWAMGREHATLTDPATLDLAEDQSRTLLAAMQPYFSTEGIALHYFEPTRWLAEGDVFRNLPTASLDRVLGRNVDRWLPPSKAIKLLQNEMQMLLYNHPVNDLRAANGQRAVNSFWLSGTGALAETVATRPQVSTTRALVLPALADDWAAYADAWMQLDTTVIASLLAQQNSGQTVRLSLCGDSNAMTFETTQQGLLTKFKNLLSAQPPINLLKQL
jgi:hypothetical protein